VPDGVRRPNMTTWLAVGFLYYLKTCSRAGSVA
jgi:hypothetical protein